MDPIKFALIGAGNIGGIYVDAFEQVPEANVQVVCDPVEVAGRKLADRCGVDWHADFETAVVRTDVDAVVVATPSGTHAEIAIAAARAGKHLLVEKPLEITLARVDSIIQAAEEAGVVLACVFPLAVFSWRGSGKGCAGKRQAGPPYACRHICEMVSTAKLL